MSELAAEAASAPAALGAHWDGAAPRARVASARPTAVLISVAVHLGALLVGAAAWQREARLAAAPPPSVRVSLLERPRLPSVAREAALAVAAAPAPPAPAPPPRARPRKRLLPAAQPTEPQPEPVPEAVVATEEPAADAGAGTLAPVAEGASGGQGAPGGAALAASGAGLPSGGGKPPPVLSPERRQAVLASYLQEIFRSRIAAHFQYPEEAERLGMEGLVLVRASVLPTGALWSARTLGDCPQRILCAAAERTVRAAAPFPPPPAELGGAISIDVPLNYRLE